RVYLIEDATRKPVMANDARAVPDGGLETKSAAPVVRLHAVCEKVVRDTLADESVVRQSVHEPGEIPRGRRAAARRHGDATCRQGYFVPVIGVRPSVRSEGFGVRRSQSSNGRALII